MSDYPSYYLFTSEEGAKRIGGKVTESTLDRLANHREVDFTLIGRKIHWTDSQLAAAVAYCVVTAGERATPQPTSEPGKPQQARRERTTRQQPGRVVSLDATPGRRYRTA